MKPRRDHSARPRPHRYAKHCGRVLIWIIWLLISLGMLLWHRLTYGPAIQH